MNQNNLGDPVLVMFDAGIYARGDHLELRMRGGVFVIRPRGNFHEFLLRLCDAVDAASAPAISESEMSRVCRACEQGLEGSPASWRLMPSNGSGLNIQVFDHSPSTRSKSGGKKMSWWVADSIEMELSNRHCAMLGENIRRWLSARVLAGIDC